MTEPNAVDEKARLAEEGDHNESAADADVHIDMDDSTVKFLNGQGGKYSEKEKGDKEDGSEISFTGLGKDELLRYADDPFWKKVRLILFIIFWVGWVAMLVAAIIIIVLAPRCPYRPDQHWYDKESAYQVYPKSFKDSSAAEDNGMDAGVGDLKGVHSKLSYLEELGTKILYINSFYKTGGVDNGMDVVDHKSVDPIFGTMTEFDALRKATKTKSMRMVLDFIPNHTSRNHTWFVKSQNKEGKYKDYYIWAEAPCNQYAWKNAYGGSAWSYDNVRKECYLHQYLKEEPDLNLRNADVKEELKSVMNFWFEKGVDGFNILNADYLVEANINDSISVDAKASVSLISEWRSLANGFATKPGKEKLLIVSAVGNVNDTKKFFGSTDKPAANLVTMKVLPTSITAPAFSEWISDFAMNPSSKYALCFGNQDTMRLASEVGVERVKAMLAIQMLLQGLPINYYGNEIGMKDGKVPPSLQKDPLSTLLGSSSGRDNYRTPMQWDGSINSGFSVHTPWLPVNSDFKEVNVKAQDAYFSDQLQDETSLTAFKNLSMLRQKESFQWGVSAVGVKNGILWFTRRAEGFPGYLVVINLSDSAQTLSLHKATGFPAKVNLVFHSHFTSELTSMDLKERAVAIGKNHVLVMEHET